MKPPSSERRLVNEEPGRGKQRSSEDAQKQRTRTSRDSNLLDDRARLLIRIQSRDDTRLDDVVSSLTRTGEVLGLNSNKTEGKQSATSSSGSEEKGQRRLASL